MPLLRRCEMCCLLILLSASLALANPKSTTLNAPAEDVFKAAQKAAAGHRITLPKDEGLKTLSDSGAEIKSFVFTTSFQGVAFRVIEEISVEPLPDGTSKLEVFFHKDRGSSVYVPSDSYQLREQQWQNQLEMKMSELEREKDSNERQYEVIHSIDIHTYVTKQKEILKRELDAKLEEIEQERQAKIADLAGMPTSSFSAMDAAAEKFFNLVQQNLQWNKTKATTGANH